MNPQQRCLQAKVKNQNEPKPAMPKSQDLIRSLEIKLIWTYITFKSAVKHRQLSYGYPRGQAYPPGRGNHSGYIF